ncbi:MAG TPA: UDP-glucose--hexose-1-phosphate uridylyltransferase [Pyrinomonadaceae bacterium]|nr:UDP-glucose--hexose-1-phosphate uridylyltransferase [Pyrinomonadaceae bacterium]
MTQSGVNFNPNEHPHRRLNPLTREWVLVSPHRAKRPWQGQVESVAGAALPSYDPDCYLCPGNARAGAATNPAYEGVYVFDNDFAALLPDTPADVSNELGLFVAASESGLCRVVCFSPDHSLTLSRMPATATERVVDEWARQYADLGARDLINHVQIFENRGEMMGCSNPHPHGQIWASESIPNEPAKEIAAQAGYFDENGTCLLCDYVAEELKRGERIVCENFSFAAIVPFWAVYPFETILLPKRHVGAIGELSAGERGELAQIMKRLTTRYDNLFETSFPYSMGFHQRPTDGNSYDSLHLHAHFYPPLLRSATIRKFLVGFELLGGPQRDITPESAAARLRDLSEMHYLIDPNS